MKNRIEYLLFKTVGTVIFNSKNYIEVHPGATQPLLINIKNTLGEYKVRHEIAKELSKRVNAKSICICGIESGGSYYASAVADILKIPLILFRTKEKNYGIGGVFVGNIPKIKGGLITIIEDVIGSGKTSTLNHNALTILGYKTELIAVYSFLPKLTGPLSKVKISVLSNINELCEVGEKLKIFNKNDVELIKKECNF